MEKAQTIPQLVKNQVLKNPTSIAIRYRKTPKDPISTFTYSELWQNVKEIASGFTTLGLKRGDHVALISDNRYQWIFCDLALMGLGIIDVPRGSDCNSEELNHIISHSDSTVVVFENAAQLKKWLEAKPSTKNIKAIVLIDFNDDDTKILKETKIISLLQLQESGKKNSSNQEKFEEEVENGKRRDESTIIYTSGTTGLPKGVVLTQESFVFQIERIYSHIPIKPQEIMLSVLPIWHVFERIVEYIVLNAGACIAYSKPISMVLLKDLSEINPQWLPSVPRIWESIYDGVMRKIKKSSKTKQTLFKFFTSVAITHLKIESLFHDKAPILTSYNPLLYKIISALPYFALLPIKKLGDILVFKNLTKLLGNNFVAGVSGGGALPQHVDYFFNAAGILILEGYGITETGPIVAVRKHSHSVMRTIGNPLDDIEYKILDQSGNRVPTGTKGQLFVKSPQVMKGYYKDPEKTASAIKDDWFDTGDLVIETFNRHSLKIVGRAKETVVLIGGENIEPVVLEEKLLASPLISNCMVVGQDQRYLGLLVTLNLDGVKEALAAQNVEVLDEGELINGVATQNLINAEVQNIISTKNGFKSYEKIGRVAILEKEFEVGIELTKTLKLRRNEIAKLYAKEIANLFKN